MTSLTERLRAKIEQWRGFVERHKRQAEHPFTEAAAVPAFQAALILESCADELEAELDALHAPEAPKPDAPRAPSSPHRVIHDLGCDFQNEIVGQEQIRIIDIPAGSRSAVCGCGANPALGETGPAFPPDGAEGLNR